MTHILRKRAISLFLVWLLALTFNEGVSLGPVDSALKPHCCAQVISCLLLHFIDPSVDITNEDGDVRGDGGCLRASSL